MSKPRGNATSKAHRAERHAQEIELMNQGLSQTEIAKTLGISRMTFWRDIQTLTEQYTQGNQEAFTVLRNLQVSACIDMAKEVHDGVIEPEVGNSVRGFLDSVSKLLGLNAPTKHLTATVETGDLFTMKCRKAFDGLGDAQIDAELDRIAKLPREAKKTVMDASWFPQPEPKQLGDGDDVA